MMVVAAGPAGDNVHDAGSREWALAVHTDVQLTACEQVEEHIL